DDVVLAKMQNDPQFVKSLKDNNAVLIDPRGFNDGINLFNSTSPEAVQAKTADILARANELVKASDGKMSFGDAITAALSGRTNAIIKDANPKLFKQVKVVDPAATGDLRSDGIAERLNGKAGMTPEEVKSVVDSVPAEYRPLARELMAQTGEVYSPR